MSEIYLRLISCDDKTCICSTDECTQTTRTMMIEVDE